MKKVLLVGLWALVLAAPQAVAADIRSSYCEIFIDRVASYNNSHGVNNITLYVKTLNNRLDGSIVKVAFQSQIVGTREARVACGQSGYHPSCDLLGQWIPRILGQFPGAEDYWVLELNLTNDYTFAHVYEGAFFVETDKGTRYWLNAANGGNFVIDANLKNSVDQARGGAAWNGNLENTISTSDKYRALNPGSCR